MRASERFSLTMTSKLARPAAHERGWPPKVVMCPSGGSCENSAISWSASAQGTQRQSPAQRLGEHNDIRRHAEMFQRKKFSGSAQAGQDLVENQQRAGAVALLAQSSHETDARNSHPTFGLDRLDDDCGDAGIDLIERADIIIRKMANRAGQRLERFTERRIPHQRERGHRVAVIRALEGDQACAPGVLFRELQRGLDRLGATVGEIDRVTNRAAAVRSDGSPISPAPR